MTPERIVGGACEPPFPVYVHLADNLVAAHDADKCERDPTVAHVLVTCAGYAYADADTVATMMTRLGLERHACVRLAQTVDAMFIFSTAYLMQSRCGRVVILCYRGTEPGDARQLAWRRRGRFRSRARCRWQTALTGVQSPCRIPPECPRRRGGRSLGN